ncbi:MAG TPA: ABC transporter ATP-binding protein [Acetobacteraceae bacterium]|jgi:branched-chain amino acid transport system ATP-binding protein
MPDALLSVRGIEAGYGSRQILFGVDLDVVAGEAVILLGANGSGKSTVLNTLSGFVRPRRGSILLDNQQLAGLPPHRIFRRGIVQVSQARDLFPEMSVEENLRLGAWTRRGGVVRLLQSVYASFPRLAERRTQMVRLMSGGEQQMVAIGRALMSEPRVLLLDEPSGGLAPVFVSEIASIVAALKRRHVTMVMVEQNLRLAFAVADRILVLRDGVVVQRQGAGADEEQIVRQIYL